MSGRYLLGFDVGSSSVKASLVDADNGVCVASAFYPENEAPITAVKSGWAEQDPQMWWDNAKLSLKKVMSYASVSGEDIKAIGVSYQMHGLVCVDKDMRVLGLCLTAKRLLKLLVRKSVCRIFSILPETLRRPNWLG